MAQRLFRGSGFENGVALLAQHGLHQLAERRLVFEHEDGFRTPGLDVPGKIRFQGRRLRLREPRADRF